MNRDIRDKILWTASLSKQNKKIIWLNWNLKICQQVNEMVTLFKDYESNFLLTYKEYNDCQAMFIDAE
jgi:hypothetical protein